MWWDGLASDRMFLYCSTMPARWKSDRPMSRQQFEALFPDDAACARYLVGRRWPDGFACPVCGVCKGWASNHDRPARECAGCRRQTSVTAGTVMHGSRLPLRTWFIAAHIVASHSNRIPALQLQAQVGIGSTKAAWLLLHKLRRAMVDPDRSLLQQIVEVDETGGCPSGARQTPPGALPSAPPCALPRNRILPGKSERLGLSSSRRTGTPGGFGWNGFSTGRRRRCMASTPEWSSQAPTSSPMAASATRPCRTTPTNHGLSPAETPTRSFTGCTSVFSNLKRWAKGVFHGFRQKHIQRYPDEFGPPRLLRLHSIPRIE